MKLIHYNSSTLVSVESRNQTGNTSSHAKPSGLWVSVEGEDDWKTWCIENDVRLERLNKPHEIVLSDDANILRLCSEINIDTFTTRFGRRSKDGFTGTYAIDWPAVATEYQGIIIAPYVWSRRLSRHTFWYYGWDCASGCIWDAKAVSSIVPLFEEFDNDGAPGTSGYMSFAVGE